jgi:hypothetical protein
MAEKIKLVQGDTKPVIVIALNDETSGDPIDISTATTRLKFRATGSSSILTTVTGVKLAGKLKSDGTIDSTSPYSTPGVGGRVQFLWADGDLNQPAGDYEGEIEITYADGTIQTVYDMLKFKIREDF